MIKLFFGTRYTDLGPMRAITKTALDRLAMRDIGYGWTVEMQVKAVLAGLSVTEVPVSYRKRIGKSKIAGTISGSVKAGMKILWTISALRVRGTRALQPAMPTDRFPASSSAGSTDDAS